MYYSKLSDFEINKAVAELSDTPDDFHMTDCTVTRHCKNGYTLPEILAFDPCNDPADAWPIIFEYGITVEPDRLSESLACASNYRAYFEYQHSNPLRAAMIVYLMMKQPK